MSVRRHRRRRWQQAPHTRSTRAAAMRAQIVAGHHPIELIPQSFLEHAIPGVYFLTSGFMKGALTPTRAETRDKRSNQTKQQPLQPTASATPEPRPQLAASTPGLRTATSPLAPYALRLRIRSCRGCCALQATTRADERTPACATWSSRERRTCTRCGALLRALVATRAYGREYLAVVGFAARHGTHTTSACKRTTALTAHRALLRA